MADRRYLPTFTLILWSKQTQDPVGTVWRLIRFLSGFGGAFVPRFIYGQPIRIKDKETARRLIDQHVTKLDGQVFAELGSGFELHTTIDSRTSVHMSFTVGNKSPKFVDAFILRLPIVGMQIDQVIPFQRLYQLFTGSIEIFAPFWGCIANDHNEHRFYGEVDGVKYFGTDELDRDFPIRRVDDRKVPKLIHWFNYFGPEYVARLGGKAKLLAAPVYLAKEIEELGGIVWVLQPEPLDDSKAEHLARQMQAIQYLNLFELHKRYMR